MMPPPPDIRPRESRARNMGILIAKLEYRLKSLACTKERLKSASQQPDLNGYTAEFCCITDKHYYTKNHRD